MNTTQIKFPRRCTYCKQVFTTSEQITIHNDETGHPSYEEIEN